MEPFEVKYYIRVHNIKTKQFGFIIQTANGINLIWEYAEDVKIFKTAKEAHKFKRNNCKQYDSFPLDCYVISSRDLFAEGSMRMGGNGTDYWTVRNHLGQFIHYVGDSKGYYFNNSELCACGWLSERDVLEFISQVQGDFREAYGRQKEEALKKLKEQWPMMDNAKELEAKLPEFKMEAFNLSEHVRGFGAIPEITKSKL